MRFRGGGGGEGVHVMFLVVVAFLGGTSASWFNQRIGCPFRPRKV